MQQELLAEWKETVRDEPPVLREQWLDSSKGRIALGAKMCRKLLRVIRARRAAVEAAVCSGAWAAAWWEAEVLPPGMEFEEQGSEVGIHGTWDVGRGEDHGASRPTPHAPRHHGVRLVLSREGVRTGVEHPAGTPAEEPPIAGPPSRRWTPPQAVGVEDLLDGMSPQQALFYEHPASPSAEVIRRIGQMRASPMDGQW